MNALKPHTLIQTIALHLLPGAAGTVAYVLLAPVLLSNGFPAMLAILLAAGLVIFPLEIGYLLSRRGRADDQPLIALREPLPKWQYVVFPLLMVLWGFLATGALSPLDAALAKVFGWLPDWFFIFDVESFQVFSRSALLTTFWVGLVVNGIVGPIVEEFYFRGHLLPRLPGPRAWSPVFNVVLFSLYHFWTPWQFFSRMIWLLPWGYIVVKKQNFYLMLIAHCAGNTIGWLLTWALILGS